MIYTDLDRVGKHLDNMGWTLTYAIDPVDGGEIVVLDWTQVAGLINDYEDMLALARDGELDG